MRASRTKIRILCGISGGGWLFLLEGLKASVEEGVCVNSSDSWFVFDDESKRCGKGSAGDFSGREADRCLSCQRSRAA